MQYYRMKYTGLSSNLLKFSDEVINYSEIDHHGLIPMIYADAFKEDPWPDHWDKIDLFDPNGVFLFRVDDAPVGFIISFQKEDYGYISVCAVKKEYQRKGIASQLIKSSIEYLQSKGLKTILIDVEVRNQPAIAAYEKLGFSIGHEFEG